MARMVRARTQKAFSRFFIVLLKCPTMKISGPKLGEGPVLSLSKEFTALKAGRNSLPKRLLAFLWMSPFLSAFTS